MIIFVVRSNLNFHYSQSRKNENSSQHDNRNWDPRRQCCPQYQSIRQQGRHKTSSHEDRISEEREARNDKVPELIARVCLPLGRYSTLQWIKYLTDLTLNLYIIHPMPPKVLVNNLPIVLHHQQLSNLH